MPKNKISDIKFKAKSEIDDILTIGKILEKNDLIGNVHEKKE